MDMLDVLQISPEIHKVIAVVGGGGKTSMIFQLMEELVARGKKVIITTTTHMAYEPERPFAENGEMSIVRKQLYHHGYTVAACKMLSDQDPLMDQNKIEKIKALPDGCLEELLPECDVVLVEADGAKRLPLKIPAEWEPVIPEKTDMVIGVLGLDCLGKRIMDTAHRPGAVAAFLNKNQEQTVTEEDLVKIAASKAGLCKNVGARAFRVFFNKADVLLDQRAAERMVEALRKKEVMAAYGSLRYGMNSPKNKKLAIVILAAGNSRRFGSNKLLYPVDGVPMYRRTLDRVLAVKKEMSSMIASVTVVTQYCQIKEEAEKDGFQVILNHHPEDGIASSMKLGLEASKEADACLFMVADQPWLKTETLEALIGLFYKSGKHMAALAQSGTPGNPCIFHRKYYQELMSLEGDKGGKRVLMSHMEDVVLHEIKEKKELIDMDVPLS